MSFTNWAVIVLVLAGYLYLGVYTHREFSTHHLFIKHKPSSQFLFRAPIGESDKTMDSLSESERRDETLFKEFVEEGNGWKRSLYLGF